MAKPNGTAVLISGATTGIGQCCALRLAQLGFRVFAGYRQAEDEATLGAMHPHIQPVHLDVTNDCSIRRAHEFIQNQPVEKPLQGIINNAGIVVSGPVEAISPEQWRHQLEVNFIGHIAVTQAFLPMLRQSRGRVVNMGSVAGINALPFLGPYSASKFALAAMTDSLRMELKPWGVHVALIEPGSVATPIWEKSRSAAEESQVGYSHDMKKRYGNMLDKVRQASVRSASRAVLPDRVADAVIHALTSSKPKTRYPVGTDARIRRLFSWFPDSLKDRVIASKIGINPD